MVGTPRGTAATATEGSASRDSAARPRLKLKPSGTPSTWPECKEHWARHFAVEYPELGNFLEQDDFEIEEPDDPDPLLYDCVWNEESKRFEGDEINLGRLKRAWTERRS